MSTPLDGRVALVTGGASGMGRAIATALAAASANVAIGSYLGDRPWATQAYTHQPSAADLASARAAIWATGRQGFAQPLDVRFDDEVEAFVAAATAAFNEAWWLLVALGVAASLALGPTGSPGRSGDRPRLGAA